MSARHALAVLAVVLLPVTAACSGENLWAEGAVAGPVVDDPDFVPSLTAEYFVELAFGNEFGPPTDAIRKWAFSPTVELIGETADDIVFADDVLEDIADITGLVRPRLVASSGDIRVFFVPRSRFDEIVDVSTDVEGATVALNDFDFFLTSATVVIDSTTTGTRRQHIIRQELSQAFGLLDDSFRIPESIFYAGPSNRTEYLAIDEDVLAILYSPVILPGMTRAEVEDILDTTTLP